jgi:ribosomal protein S27E
MSSPLLSLNCPNCGANLQFSPDLTQFACSYCGATIAVRSEGGAVSLLKLSETVERIESHTEQAAAELAIARYEKEIAELEAQLQQADGAHSTRTGCGCASAIALAVISLSLAHSASDLAAVPGLAAIVVAALIYRSANSSETAGLKAQLRDRRLKLAAKRRIADGDH